MSWLVTGLFHKSVTAEELLGEGETDEEKLAAAEKLLEQRLAEQKGVQHG